MKLRHVLIALLTVPLLGAAPLNCAGVVAPGLAYPDPTGRWMGAELTLCDRLAAHLHRSSTRFTPILQSSDAPPPLDGDDVLFLPQQAIPKGFRAGPLLTDARQKGSHGYNPALPEMRASFILYGAGVAKCSSLPGVNIVDVGPTAAALLGITMPNTEGVAVDHTGAR